MRSRLTRGLYTLLLMGRHLRLAQTSLGLSGYRVDNLVHSAKLLVIVGFFNSEIPKKFSKKFLSNGLGGRGPASEFLRACAERRSGSSSRLRSFISMLFWHPKDL